MKLVPIKVKVDKKVVETTKRVFEIEDFADCQVADLPQVTLMERVNYAEDLYARRLATAANSDKVAVGKTREEAQAAIMTGEIGNDALAELGRLNKECVAAHGNADALKVARAEVNTFLDAIYNAYLKEGETTDA
jgi:hypothetical protein